MMHLIWLILVGGVAGYIATRALNIRTGVLATVLIGMGGALVGGFVLRLVLAVLGVFGALLGAVLGALLLIWVVNSLSRR